MTSRDYQNGFKNGQIGYVDKTKASLYRQGGPLESKTQRVRDYWTGAYDGLQQTEPDLAQMFDMAYEDQCRDACGL